MKNMQIALSVLLIFALLFPTAASALVSEEPLQLTAAKPESEAERTVTWEDVYAGVADPRDMYDPLDPATVPDVIGYETAYERSHVERLYDEEPDLFTVIFLNANGTKTAYLYDYPVKYADENGEIKDISLAIQSDADAFGAFETAENSIQTTFSRNLTDGIRLSDGDISIQMIPMPAKETVVVSSKLYASSSPVASSMAKKIGEETVSYDYDNKTTIEYSLTYTGFKEEIVVSEYTGQTSYDFTLMTNGLALTERDGSFYLTDSEGGIRANIGDIIIFTADERNNTFGSLTARTVTANQEYVLTVHVDEAFLRDENTAYPIRIDPTIEINYDSNGSGAIEDVTINSLQGSDGSSGSLFVGKRATYGISRTLMKFPTLSLSSIPAVSNIESATVELRDELCEGTAMTVYCYVFTGNTWSESTADWSSVSPNSYSTLLSSVSVSYSNGAALSPTHRYAFDITDAVRGWKLGNYSQAKGLLFKASSTVENASTYLHKTFASYNRSSNKPSLSITYNTNTQNTVINDGIYYVNNQQHGKYLRYTSSAVSVSSGLLSSLGNTIRWKIQKVEGGYVLRAYSDTTAYLGVSETNSYGVKYYTVNNTEIPPECIWNISIADNGGCWIKSTANADGETKYLYTTGSFLGVTISRGTTGTALYNTRVWRIASTSFYGNTSSYTARELSVSSNFPNQELEVAQSKHFYINNFYGNETWCNPANDFTYSISSSEKISIDSGKISALSRGVVSVTATHKVTNRVKTFEVFVKNSLINEADYEAIISSFESLEGTGYYIAAGYNYITVSEAILDVLEYDQTITEYCNTYRIPKEFVQSVLFREIWCYNIADAAGDVQVQEHYADLENGRTPTVARSDSSTGIAQIYAETAIKAINHADDRGFLELTAQYDFNDWQDVWYIWKRLHDNDIFNLHCCTLVILDCQYEFASTVPYADFFDYSETQIKTILKRYNGTEEAVTEKYARATYEYYKIFEQYNNG